MSIQLENLAFCYPGAANRVLDGLSLIFPEGKVTAVLGMSGSGKTTLLNLMGLLDNRPPVQGTICYRDQDYKTVSESSAARMRREDFGFVLQSSYLLPNFRCGQNVTMPLVLQQCTKSVRAKALKRLIDAVETRSEFGLANAAESLTGVASRFPSGASGGERQRMAVLRAMIHDPSLIFADEPFASLDPVNARRIANLLLAWQRGELTSETQKQDRTLILVMHQIELAYEIADYFVLLKSGKAHGPGVLSKSDLNGGAEQIKAIIS